MYPPSPSDRAIFAALRGFLLAVVPTGTAQFSGYIAGTTLTVTGVKSGTIGIGDAILGENVLAGSFVSALGTGTGGVGTYTVSQSQTIGAVGKPISMWTGVQVIKAQVNRTPEPRPGDFMVMTELFRKRLSTNVDTYNDVVFTGSIAGATMTVSAVTRGTIAVGATLSGTGIADNVRIMAFGSGTGGVGTYSVFPAQTISSRTIASGVERFLQPIEYTLQIDAHGPNAGDFAQTVTTLFRDLWGTDKFRELNPFVTPLYADDPKQIPFVNGEQQIEDRWVITARLQVNETTETPMQFADEAIVTVIDVEGAYPA